jgi:hypothetical protein
MDVRRGELQLAQALQGPRPDALNRATGASSMGEAFEALLLQQLFVSMRQTVPKSGLFAGSSTDGLYDHLIEQAMGDHLAKSGGIGLAALFGEPPAPSTQEVAPRRYAWAGEVSGVVSGDVSGDGDVADRAGTCYPRRVRPRPLADDLPPQDDRWLDQPDAAGRLRALLGER